MSVLGRDDPYAVFSIMTLSANPGATEALGSIARSMAARDRSVGLGLTLNGRARSARPTLHEHRTGWVGRSARDHAVGSGWASQP